MILPFIIFLSSFAPSVTTAAPQPMPTLQRSVVTTYAGLEKMAGIRAGGVYAVGQSNDGPGPTPDQVCTSGCQSDLNNAYTQCAFGVAGPPPLESIYQCQAYADQEFFGCIAACNSG